MLLILTGVERDLGNYGRLSCTGMLHDSRGRFILPRIFIHRGKYGISALVHNRCWLYQLHWTCRILVFPVCPLQRYRQYLLKLMWSVSAGNSDWLIEFVPVLLSSLYFTGCMGWHFCCWLWCEHMWWNLPTCIFLNLQLWTNVRIVCRRTHLIQ